MALDTRPTRFADLRSGPTGFGTLFLTDMWERFGFFSMQAILALYASAAVADGGLGLPTSTAAALFGVYIGLTFMLSLPGGWVGDRIVGPRTAVLIGGVVITAGHAAIAYSGPVPTVAGLILVAAGTGLVKPNMTAMLGLVFGADSISREAAISVFYIGIQVSALAAPLISGFVGETVNWRLGFVAAAVAMAIGTVQYFLGTRKLGSLGLRPPNPAPPAVRAAVLRRFLLVVAAVAAFATALGVAGKLSPTPVIALLGLCTLVAPVAGYRFLTRRPELSTADRGRLRTFLWIFLGSTLFWLVIAQGGSILSIFARSSTDRMFLGTHIPASWLQAATPLFILLLAPLFARWWLRVGPSLRVPVRFTIGLSLAGSSLIIMAVAAALAHGGHKVSPLWLLSVYLLHAVGELIAAAVGMSAAVEVAPRGFVGQTVGLWWLFCAVGGGLSSQVVRLTAVVPAPLYFLAVGLVVLGMAALLYVRRDRIQRGLELRS